MGLAVGVLVVGLVVGVLVGASVGVRVVGLAVGVLVGVRVVGLATANPLQMATGASPPVLGTAVVEPKLVLNQTSPAPSSKHPGG